MKDKRKFCLEEVLCTILLIVIFATATFQVLNRFAFKLTIAWTEELCRYSFIWLSLIGVSLGIKNNKHMNVDLIDKALSPKGRLILGIIVDLIFLAACYFFITWGWVLVAKVMKYGQKSAGLGIQKWIIYLALPTCGILSCFRLIQKNVRLFIDRKKEGKEEK